ncbi:MAG: response regulator, partial [Candidatus Eremiobacteraeota bacterium]|nr:response regulator [Candidatus Eremiobacteraeota bacterium]
MDEERPPSTILIVDDAPENIKVLGGALTQDYKILVARDGESALKLARTEPVDMVLLDIVMPGIDGYEVCRRLKADEMTRELPVIFITTLDATEDETTGLELGAVDYITKPFRLPIVKARVKTHMDLKAKNDLLLRLANVDGLTGVPNRRCFDVTLEKEWRRA